MRQYNLHGVNGQRGFCADGQTLTKYIWEYLGNTMPSDIYGGATDTTPPAAITNLSATTGSTRGTVNLSWTAPGDDANTGTASAYIIKYATSAITTDAQFNTATTVNNPPQPAVAGSIHNITVSGLTPGTTYYFAIKTQDEVPNISTLSNCASAIAKVNTAPVLTPIGNKTVNENSTLTFTISASDVDGDSLTYSVANLPTGATFNTSTKTFSWTPNYNQQGIYNVTFNVSDNWGGTATETITITVNNVNRAPVLADIGNKTVAENTTLNFTISATDPDGDPLNYTAEFLPVGASFNASTRTFSWTPTYDQQGTYTGIRFTVSDGSLTDYEVISITVTNVNRSPIWSAIGDKSIAENSLLTFVVNATDPDGDALTYSVSNLPEGATFNSSTRTFSWTPTFTQSGIYNVTFSVSDSNAATANQTITITVSNVNRAPVLASIGNKTVNEASTLSFTLSATDPDGDSVTYSSPNLPNGATLNASTGVFSWTPNINQAGNYSVTFLAVDPLGASAQQTITISVGNVNQPPVLSTIGNRTVAEGATVTFTVSGTDADLDTLIYSVSNLPQGATFVNQTFTWTPSYNQAGSYSIIFTVNDGHGGEDSESIVITVTNTNRAPILSAIGNKNVQANSLLSFSVVASDPDGENLIYSVSNLPVGATFLNQTFNWTPSNSQTGNHMVTFTVRDPYNASASETITITVQAVDTQPPYLSELNPQDGEVQVPRNTAIKLHIKDDGVGVNINTINLSIQREGDAWPTKIIENGLNQLSLYENAVIISGGPSDYAIIYTPPSAKGYRFFYNQDITVFVSAKDLAGNDMGTVRYSFTTTMLLRGVNLKISTR
ncbi:MAG: putative Ig domain-containing protein, partial [Candidatus Omnitrophica bacterium]|nr:putative Ig domain-containing protein [Candidatus Omnitrophota bacterium]